MLRIKSRLLLVLIALMLTAMNCMEEEYGITYKVINKSSESIYVGEFFSYSSESLPSDPYLITYNDMTYLQPDSSATMWTNLDSGTKVLVVIKSATMKQYIDCDFDCPIYADWKLIFKNSDLESLNYKIIYTDE